MADAALTPQIVRGLNDKLYEKRKAAALEIERYVSVEWSRNFALLRCEQCAFSHILSDNLTDLSERPPQ